jgi:hypothetical protein
MNILVGFGKTETDFEQRECDFVEDFLRERTASTDYNMNTDEVVAGLKAALGERAEEFKNKDDAYKTAPNYPERYSYYWYRVVHDIHDLCVIFDFHHINRRHALSKDGWALWPNRRVYHFTRRGL